ncbi:hypothetical protein [Methylocystis sp. S23]
MIFRLWDVVQEALGNVGNTKPNGVALQIVRISQRLCMLSRNGWGATFMPLPERSGMYLDGLFQ